MAESRPEWVLPRDNRLLVEASTHEGALRELAERFGPEWKERLNELLGKRAADRNHAALLCLNWGKPFSDAGNVIARGGMERIGTRLGVADRLIRFAEEADSPLGNRISGIRIPGWFFSVGEKGNNSEEPDEPVQVEARDNALRFGVNGRVFWYARHGLMSEREWEEERV